MTSKLVTLNEIQKNSYTAMEGNGRPQRLWPTHYL